MELFTFIVLLLVEVIAMQYRLFWLMFLLAAVIVYLAKDKKTFIIVSIVSFILWYIAGTPLEEYSIYVLAGAVVIFIMINKNSDAGEADIYNPNDQFGDLLKGLGGQ